MKTLEVAMLKIYLPDDEAHVKRVLDAIESFCPGGDVHVYELRPAFDREGNRLASMDQRTLVIEYVEETCRAQIFVDAFHDVIKPGRVIGDFVYLCAGDEEGTDEQPEALG
jgi:hypothetical protein